MATEPLSGESTRSVVFRDQKGNFYALPEDRIEELRMSDEEVEKFLASFARAGGAPATPFFGSAPGPSAFMRAAPGAFLRATPSAFMRASPGAFVRATPGSFVRAAPGAFVRAVPGAFVRAAPGAFVRAVPGAFVRAVPGWHAPPVVQAVPMQVTPAPQSHEGAGPAFVGTWVR